MSRDAIPCIVVVDDDPAFREFMADLLSDEGYQLVPWSAAAGAPALVAATQPSLVILDIRLEEPDAGWQVLTQLQAYPGTNQIPVIVCSADDSLRHTTAGWFAQRGCWVVQKPFAVDELLATIAQALSPHSFALGE